MGIVVTPNTLELDVTESQIFTVSGHTGEVFVDAPIGAGLCTITKLTSTTWQVTRNSLGTINIRFSESPFGNDYGRLIGNDDGKTELLADGTMKFTNISSALVFYQTTAKMTTVGDYATIKGKVIWNPSTGGNFFMYLLSPWGGSGSIEPSDPAKTYKLEKVGYDKAQFYIDGVASGGQSTFAGGNCWVGLGVGVSNSGLNSIIPRLEWNGSILNYSQTIATINNPTPDTTKPNDVVLTSATVVNAGQINIAFQTPLVDNKAVTKLKVQRATNSAFTTGLVEYETTTLTSPYVNNADLNPSDDTEYFYRFKAGDQAGNWSLNWSNVVSATIYPLKITETSPLQTAEIGVAYNNPISLSGGIGTKTVSVETGFTLPSGFSIVGNAIVCSNPSVVVSNHPTRLKALDSTGATVTKDFLFTVADTNPPPAPTGFVATKINNSRVDTDSNIPSDAAGIGSYDTQFATNSSFTGIVNTINHTNKSYSVTIGLNPSNDTTYWFRRRAIDNNGLVGPWCDPVQVAMTVPVSITTSSPLTAVVIGDSVSGSFAAAGGSGNGNFSVHSGNLPSGVSLAVNGARSGSPSAIGTFNFTIRYVDANNPANYVDKDFVWVINPLPPVITTNSPLPYARTGHGFTFQLQKSGGTGSGSWAAISGNLPGGALASNGLITIAEVGNANYVFAARYTDTNGTYATKTFTIPVSELAVWDFCMKYSLQFEHNKKVRIFKPRQGARQTRTDSPAKRKLTVNLGYYSRQKQRDILAFWNEHFPAKNFLFYDDYAEDYFEAYISTPLSEARNLSWGGIDLVIEEV